MRRLLVAFSKLRRDDLQLVIAGEGCERQGLEDLSRHLKIDKNISFLGHRDDVPEVLRSLDVYTLTSDTEQMPNSLLQAMAAGRPVAAVNVGDVASILPPAGRDFVCEKDDDTGLVRNLHRLVNDAELREDLGRANQSHVRAVYGLDRMVEAYGALFEGALARPQVTTQAGSPLSIADANS